ncbi:MAG: hypothetical protein AAF318_19405 [Pseudomonadota bacterium]
MSKRRLPPIDTEAILARLGPCRIAMVELAMGSPNRSLQRSCAAAMIANIDEIAWLLTGERDHFHTKGHGPFLSGGRR